MCHPGKVMMIAAIDAGQTATARARANFETAPPLLLPKGEVRDAFDIQWMPPGEQRIKCHVANEPRDMVFAVNPEHALTMNAMLQWFRAKAAAGEGDEPFIDFNHEDGAASGRPTEMYWGGPDLKSGGIRLRGKWTGSGKSAVANRDFTRFSPQWDFDSKTDEPMGIGVNLGGLVNRAAFKQMQAVAKDATKNTKGKNGMEEKKFKELLDEVLKPVTDRLSAIEAANATAKAADATKGTATASAAAADDGKIIKLIQEANKPLMDKITTFETAQQNAQTASAKDAVMKHVGRGAIAPADADTIGFYTTAYAKDPTGTEKVLAKLPGKSMRAMTSSAAGMTTTATGGEPEYRFIAKAKEFGKANDITGHAEALTAYARTAEGQELYAEFREKITPNK